MIESLKIEIRPVRQEDFPDWFRVREDYGVVEELIVKVVKDGVLYERRTPLGDQELELTFDQIWDEAKVEMFNYTLTRTSRCQVPRPKSVFEKSR